MTPEDFASCFDRFQSTAFRLETLQRYTVEEDAAHIAAWRAGQARPDYSVRTSPWAARLATTTIAGKSWCRVRVVELPLSEYVRWEAAAYPESAVLGEEIRVLVRTDRFASLTEDFWLFDAGEDQPYAIAMVYDEVGRPGDHKLVTDPGVIAHYAQTAAAAWEAAGPLNEFLAAHDLRPTT